MERANNFAAVILAGGKSSRMGKNKALLKINNKYIIEIIAEKLRKITPNIFISSNSLDLDFLPYKKIEDIIKNCGPICGIYSALKNLPYEKIIITPCDSPFIPIDIFKMLLQQNTNTWISYKKRINPLIGIYYKTITSIIKQHIDNKNFKLLHLSPYFKIINIKNLPEYTFLNINYPEDYQRAIQLSKR